ncbi:hypothetical protein C8R43DRAFT_1243316 [Mycena crocata]|nr:hypothetical protein C8R43DRAFT_1243316 [Mycena crocata]
MSEFAIVNLDKREYVDSGGYGYKVAEAFMNGMPPDFMWLFTVPADNQASPANPVDNPRSRSIFRAATDRVPIGHWAGDRVLIVDEYSGKTKKIIPPELLAQYPTADADDDVLDFAQEHLTRIDLPHPGNAYGATKDNEDITRFKAERDACFPTDRVWVVRNLSKKWYARADVVFKAKHLRGPAVAQGVGFGHLLWGELGGAQLAASVHRKGGAGDRFVIRPLEAVEGAEEWEDLSEAAKSCMNRFKRSYDRELGDDY